jgi:glycosyltransferase involved in cell wall biosynthesis
MRTAENSLSHAAVLPSQFADLGGIAEVVRVARAGIIVLPMDAEGMAAAIVRMAAFDQERAQFTSNAEAAFHSRFSLRTMADAYMDLYRNARQTRHHRKQPVLL